MLALAENVAPWCLGVLLLSAVLCLVRLVRGPYQADRVVALDLISLLAVMIFGLLSVQDRTPHFLSVALVLALVAFLTVVAWAFYLLHQARYARKEGEDDR